MIAAILGTLKAGAAYVPLDPAAPAERLRMILADTRPRVLLTQRSLRDRLPDLEAAVLCIDDPVADAEAGDASRPPETGVRSDDLAYIIYTSGSTGRPKGVMVEHRAICNTILWRDRDVTIHADDRRPEQPAVHVRPVAGTDLPRAGVRGAGWSWPSRARSTTRTGCSSAW